MVMQLSAAPDGVGVLHLGVMISAPSPMLASSFPLFVQIVFEPIVRRSRTEPPKDT
jgi:hypothetical protein